MSAAQSDIRDAAERLSNAIFGHTMPRVERHTENLKALNDGRFLCAGDLKRIRVKKESLKDKTKSVYVIECNDVEHETDDFYVLGETHFVRREVPHNGSHAFVETTAAIRMTEPKHATT